MVNPAISEEKQKLSTAINTNQQMVAIFEAEAFEKEWAEGNIVRQAQLNSSPLSYQVRDDLKTIIGHSIDAISVMKFTKMAADMGLNGEVVLKNYAGKSFVIFKSTGNLHHFITQLKQRLNRSKHITAKPKVVQMAIGNAQASQGAVRGGMITFAIFTAINIMDYIIRDQATFARLAGTIASDFAKISVGALAGYTMHALTAVVFHAFGVSSTIALSLGPIGFGIAAGIGIGFLLNLIDNKYGLTDKIIDSLNKFFYDGKSRKNEIKQTLNYIEQNPIQAFSRIFGSPVLPF